MRHARVRAANVCDLLQGRSEVQNQELKRQLGEGAGIVVSSAGPSVGQRALQPCLSVRAKFKCPTAGRWPNGAEEFQAGKPE